MNKTRMPLIRFNKELGFSTSDERSNLMKNIRGKNTKPEVLLRKKLWSLGIRYRLNVRKLVGTPDIVIEKYKVVIFIDGEFWHGYKWEHKKERIKANREFWLPKIERNIERDIEVNNKLTQAGYKIFRFWGHQITKGIDDCVKTIIDYIHNIEKLG